MMDIIIGKQYWVNTNTYQHNIISENDYNLLKYCTFIQEEESEGDTIYCFNQNDNDKICYRVSSFVLDCLVFKTCDDYLRFIVSYVILLNKKIYSIRNIETPQYYIFDNFMKNKIKESQEKNPEKWL